MKTIAYPHQQSVQGVLSRILVDMVLILDATGSMQPFLDAIVNALLRIIEILTSGSLNANLGVVVFRDEKYGEPAELSPVGTPPEAIRSILRQTVATGGGDEEESSLLAIKHALSLHGYREGAQKVLLLVTDAPPHDPEGNVDSESIVAMLREHGAVLHACTPPIEPYLTFAKATQGTLFEIQPNMPVDAFENLLISVAHTTVKTVTMLRSRHIQEIAREQIRKTRALGDWENPRG